MQHRLFEFNSTLQGSEVVVITETLLSDQEVMIHDQGSIIIYDLMIQTKGRPNL